MRTILLLSVVLGGLGGFGSGCSSSTLKEGIPEERAHEAIERDYIVKDSSGIKRPAWIEDPELWAKHYGKDLGKFRYFSYETEPKVNRDIACSIAKAKAKSDIAGEIATSITKGLVTSQEGQAGIDENNPSPQPLREFVENTLTENIQATLHGAAMAKSYWEKRRYMKEKGARKDFMAYICAVLIRMESTVLQKGVQRAIQKAVTQAVRKTKAKDRAHIQKALEKAAHDLLTDEGRGSDHSKSESLP